jgi:hypothetical protein
LAQLVKMAAEGLVECISESRGVGRPVQVWKLTAVGNGRFPDAQSIEGRPMALGPRMELLVSGLQAFVCDVCVDLGGIDVAVTEHHLY